MIGWLTSIQSAVVKLIGAVTAGYAVTAIAVKSGVVNTEAIIIALVDWIFAILSSIGFDEQQIRTRSEQAVGVVETLAGEFGKFEQVVPLLACMGILGGGIAAALFIRLIRHVLSFVPTLNAG